MAPRTGPATWACSHSQAVHLISKLDRPVKTIRGSMRSSDRRGWHDGSMGPLACPRWGCLRRFGNASACTALARAGSGHPRRWAPRTAAAAVA
eukprot:837314-Prymnesium_polylepis.1